MIPLPTSEDNDDENEGAAAVWSFLVVLFLFKLVTVVLIFWHFRTWEAGLFLGSTFWYFIPPMVLLVAGPAIFYYRLRKVRARREALRRAEWMIDDQDVEVAVERKR
jgi:hypothetical protein